MNAVFDTRPETSYDDDIIRRYHFPNRYLPEARKSVGDWIVYREPQRGGGRRGYVAVARVTRIETDPTDDASSYVYVSDFLPFNMVVPFHRETACYETRLDTIEDRSRVGAELRASPHHIWISQDKDELLILWILINELSEKYLWNNIDFTDYISSLQRTLHD